MPCGGTLGAHGPRPRPRVCGAVPIDGRLRLLAGRGSVGGHGAFGKRGGIGRGCRLFGGRGGAVGGRRWRARWAAGRWWLSVAFAMWQHAATPAVKQLPQLLVCRGAWVALPDCPSPVMPSATTSEPTSCAGRRAIWHSRDLASGTVRDRDPGRRLSPTRGFGCGRLGDRGPRGATGHPHGSGACGAWAKRPRLPARSLQVGSPTRTTAAGSATNAPHGNTNVATDPDPDPRAT